jgi:hypothetical protein
LLFHGDENEEPRICGDVLIEIVAAMAPYGRNFILLWRRASPFRRTCGGFVSVVTAANN